MATPHEVETAKEEARSIAKDFANGIELQPGFSTLYTWVYREGCEGLQGDFTDAQLEEILDAGAALLPAIA